MRSVRRSNPTLPDRPSIAVLPFQNISADPEQEYFADGMADIITAPSRFPSLFVIARSSSFTYKGDWLSAVTAIEAFHRRRGIVPSDCFGAILLKKSLTRIHE
jgi:TolB-like protein